MLHTFEMDGATFEFSLSPTRGGYHLRVQNGWEGFVSIFEEGAGQGRLTAAGSTERAVFAVDGDTVHVHLRGRTRSITYLDPLRLLAISDDEGGHNVARAPMPGVVVAVKVSPGDKVAAGTVLMVIESMKLETQIRASQDGTVELLHVKEGQSFDRDAVLATLS